MKKFVKRNFGAILLFLAACLFMILNIIYSPYTYQASGSKDDQAILTNLLHFLSISPSLCLMALVMCWIIKRAEGNKNSMRRTFKKNYPAILFVLFGLWLVFIPIFSPVKSQINDAFSVFSPDFPDKGNQGIVISLLSGILVTLIIYFAAWCQAWAARWSLASKRKRLAIVRAKLERVTSLKEDKEKLVLELAGAIKTTLVCLALSAASETFAFAFPIFFVISNELDSSFYESSLLDLVSQFPVLVMAEGSAVIFGVITLAICVRTCLDSVGLMANLKNFQVFQSKMDKSLAALNASIESS